VDDALDAALEIGLERQDVAVGRQGHVVVLKVVRDIVLIGKVLHAAHAVLVYAAKLAAHEEQAGGAFVLEVAVVAHTAVQGREGHLGQGLGAGEGVEQGAARRTGMDAFRRAAGKAEGGLERPEAVHFEQRVGMAAHIGQKAGNIGEGNEAEIPFGKPVAYLVVQVLTAAHVLRVVHRAQAKSGFLPCLGKAEGGKPFEDAGELEGAERAFVHDQACWRRAFTAALTALPSTRPL